MKFAAWLTANHINQNTPMGDLARNAKRDPTWPVNANSEHQILDYLSSVRASDSTILAFKTAWKAYLTIEG